MRKIKPIALAVAIPVLIGGWAAFRPELLFINSKVNEKAPIVAGQSSKQLSTGEFVSYAHETTGKAEVIEVGDKKFLRLTNFHTSNGPDVRVYLVKGTDSGNAGVDKGFLDLGVIKGTMGDQNYEIPAGTNLDEYQAVSIWCARFSVGFGGATLESKAPQTSSVQPGWTLASFGDPIRVTSGSFTADQAKTSGYAEIVEQDGKRTLNLKNIKVSGNSVRVFLVKAETIRNSGDVKKAQKLDLGLLKTSAKQSFSVPKDIDLWLYRSVSLWDTKKNINLGDADLRSDQERPKTFA